MGLLRVLLASAVVIGHAPGWGAEPVPFFQPLSPYYAVQAFFVISGFYMALLRERYVTSTWIFYSNRYSRLIVSYLIVVSVTLLLAALHPENSFPFIHTATASAAQAVVLGTANFTIFGADLVEVLSDFWSQGLIIPQGWTLGIELWFYLLVPLLWRLRTQWLIGLLAASLLCRVAFINSGLPFFPWQQRFFPVELMFFLIGMLAFRYREFITHCMPRGSYVLGAVVAATCMIGWLVPDQHWSVSFLLGVVLCLAMPPIFALTHVSKFDSLIGEFSYPIYLWHVCIGYFCMTYVVLWGSGFLLLASILASGPLVFFVELPLERWRSQRLRRFKNRQIELRHVASVD